jgi:hypothetical protein
MRRRSLYKYFSEVLWAEHFLDGKILFRSLSYFRDYEDNEVRGDRNEGLATLRPPGGLVVNNQTQGKTFTIPGAAFESSAREEEIFVFCASRTLSRQLREEFAAVACVEVTDIAAFCSRVQTALPPNAVFPGPKGCTRLGNRVTYYTESEAVNPRWALPDLMATSKPARYDWQDEFRLVFSLTDALEFEKVVTCVVQGESTRRSDPARHHSYLVNAGNLLDICRIVPFD